MKKLFYLGAMSALLLTACGEEKAAPKEEAPASEPVEVNEEPVTAEVETQENEDVKESESTDEKIKRELEGIVSKDLNSTSITEIAVNNYQGEADKYIVLPHLVWDVPNSKETTVEMLEMYSDHIAANLYEQGSIEEITVFWEVPYHLEGESIAKFNYIRNANGMAKNDKWLASELQ